MTADPAPANHDRLAEIEHEYAQLDRDCCQWCDYAGWLIAEVKRLRATLLQTADAPCTHCAATWLHGERNTAHFLADQVLHHPADWHH